MRSFKIQVDSPMATYWTGLANAVGLSVGEVAFRATMQEMQRIEQLIFAEQRRLEEEARHESELGVDRRTSEEDGSGATTSATVEVQGDSSSGSEAEVEGPAGTTTE